MRTLRVVAGDGPDLPAEVADRQGARPLQRVRGAVAFDRVTFAYRPELRPALQEVSFEVEPGQLVALVGPTGAGKSTAVSLVPRFHDPQHGRVLVDGHDVRELTLESLGSHIGIVFQDTFLFHARSPTTCATPGPTPPTTNWSPPPPPPTCTVYQLAA